MKNLTQTFQDLENRVRERVSQLDLHSADLSAIGSTVIFLRQAIYGLKETVRAHHFATEAEEITFFKEMKPIIASQYYYHNKVFSLRTKCSFEKPSARNHFFEKSLGKLQSYVDRNYAFFEYCLSGRTDLDSNYFVRRKVGHTVIADETFCTTHDDKLARIRSVELSKEFILTAIHRSKSEAPHGGPSLRWTASKTDLTELIYALQAADVFNDDKSDIKQIATTFESMFNISLGDYYRTFQAIQSRKNNQMVFIAKLKDRLQARLDDNS